MQITYAELKDIINGLTPQQLRQPVMVYAADIDDAMPVFATCVNTDQVMGHSLDGLAKTQLLLQI
jgi:hypothetical protein